VLFLNTLGLFPSLDIMVELHSHTKRQEKITFHIFYSMRSYTEDEKIKAFPEINLSVVTSWMRVVSKYTSINFATFWKDLLAITLSSNPLRHENIRSSLSITPSRCAPKRGGRTMLPDCSSPVRSFKKQWCCRQGNMKRFNWFTPQPIPATESTEWLVQWNFWN